MTNLDTSTKRHVAHYPLFIDMRNAPVAVIGGGSVATRKVQALLEHGARVKLVSPEITPELRELAGQDRIEWVRRAYAEGDLEGMLLAVAATNDDSANEAVHAEATHRAMLVNVVDVPHLCNCIVPSTMSRGRLQIAVSTGGASPSAARQIRLDLEQAYPECWETYMDLLFDVRQLVKARVPGPAAVRTPLFQALCESDLLDRISTGEAIDAETAYAQIVKPLLAGGIA